MGNNKLTEILNNRAIREVLDALGDGLSIQDTNFRILYQNRKAIEMIGDHAGKYCYEVYERTDRICASCPLALSFQDGKTHTVERVNPLRPLTVEITASPMFDEEHAIIGGIELVRDITGRKKFETFLKKAAEGVSANTGGTFFTSLVTYLAESVGTDYAFIGELSGEKPRTVNTIAVYALGSIADNFEYSLASTPCEQVVGRELCCFTSGVQQKFPEDRLLKDMGIESYVGIPLFDSRELPLGILVIMHRKPLQNSDLTATLLRIFAVRAATEIERKNAEKQLQMERDRAQNYLDIAGVIIVVLNADGTVALINKRGCEILGLKEEDIVGKNWFENFVPENVRGEVCKAFENLMAGKVDFVKYYENPVFTGRGEERIIAWHNSLLRDETGRITGTLSSGEDITLRKKIEEDLKERIQELEHFYDMAIGRELRMKELKEELDKVKAELRKKSH